MRRTDRVADLLRQEICDILLRDLSDPRLGMTTVSNVDVSPDLSHARIAVSALGADRDREDAIEALHGATSFIRGRLAGRLRDIRRIPALRFELDRGAEHSQRISDLLENLDDPNDNDTT